MMTQEEAYVPQAVGPELFSFEGEETAVSGFIFMCNRQTKPECYRYRVFGLPAASAKMMENITPGTTLFLFDFEAKLLYGVYTSTSFGRMNLQPNAFGGRFPAQVSFRIHADCLPVPEHSFRRIILENYCKGKFKQELNAQQVQNLLALFRPINMPSSVNRYPVVVSAAAPISPKLADFDNHFQANSQFPSTLQVQRIDSAQLNPRSIAFRPQHNTHNDPESQHTGSLLDQHALPDTRLPLPGDSCATGRHFKHARTVLNAESDPDRSLSSQITYFGDVTVSMRQYHHAPLMQQTSAASSPLYSVPVQEPYLPRQPAGSLADPQTVYFSRFC